MKRTMLPIIIVLLLSSLPSMAARTTAVPVVHDTNIVFQAYQTGCPTPVAVPGVLSLSPTDLVQSIAQQTPFTIKSVVLEKQTPELNQCGDVFPARTTRQQGMANIRRWWPLMYEVPGTTWTLTIIYGTSMPFDDDGPGPNPKGYVHTEIWRWRVEASIQSMKDLLVLFRQLPYGTSEMPLISDDTLYHALQTKLDQIAVAVAAGKTTDAAILLGDFEMEVMDACVPDPPVDMTNSGTGIAGSAENPACCKLLVDAEYVGRKLGILQ